MENPPYTLLSIRQISARLGISKSTIYRRLDHKDKLYDPKFPRPLKVGETTTRWIENEVTEWIENLIKTQRNAA
jgi:prophage regulatory protein